MKLLCKIFRHKLKPIDHLGRMTYYSKCKRCGWGSEVRWLKSLIVK